MNWEVSPLFFHILAELSGSKGIKQDCWWCWIFLVPFDQCHTFLTGRKYFKTRFPFIILRSKWASSNGVSWVHCNSLLPRSLGSDGAVWVVSAVLPLFVLPLTRTVLFCFVLIRHKRISFFDINCNSIIPCLWIQTIMITKEKCCVVSTNYWHESILRCNKNAGRSHW